MSNSFRTISASKSRHTARWQKSIAAEPSIASRAAFTLIEMMVVLSMTSIVLGTIGVLWHGVSRVQRSTDDHRLMLDTLARLSQQYRQDIHAANSVQVLSTGGATESTTPAETVEKPARDAPQESTQEAPRSRLMVALTGGEQVEYRVGPTAIDRTERSGEEILRRETYNLPPDATVNWQVEALPSKSDAPTRQASLLVSYPLGGKEFEFSDRRNLRIDAIVGLCPAALSLKETGK